MAGRQPVQDFGLAGRPDFDLLAALEVAHVLDDVRARHQEIVNPGIDIIDFLPQLIQGLLSAHASIRPFPLCWKVISAAVIKPCLCKIKENVDTSAGDS
jgi:hypothetical protein